MFSRSYTHEGWANAEKGLWYFSSDTYVVRYNAISLVIVVITMSRKQLPILSLYSVPTP